MEKEIEQNQSISSNPRAIKRFTYATGIISVLAIILWTLDKTIEQDQLGKIGGILFIVLIGAVLVSNIKLYIDNLKYSGLSSENVALNDKLKSEISRLEDELKTGSENLDQLEKTYYDELEKNRLDINDSILSELLAHTYNIGFLIHDFKTCHLLANDIKSKFFSKQEIEKLSPEIVKERIRSLIGTLTNKICHLTYKITKKIVQ